MFEKDTLFHKPAFHVLIWAIINQQLSVASARSIESKLQNLHRGTVFRQPTISTLSDNQLKACGLSRQKIRYIRALCDAVAQKSLRLRSLPYKTNDEIGDILTTLPGIGPWTIDMFLMFSLGRLDVLPLGDLALRKAISNTYNTHDSEAMLSISQRWAPYQTIASWYLWNTVD